MYKKILSILICVFALFIMIGCNGNNENKDVIEKFTRAISNGLKYVDKNSPEVIAKDILEYFPDTTLETVTNAVKRF